MAPMKVNKGCQNVTIWTEQITIKESLFFMSSYVLWLGSLTTIKFTEFN